MKNLLIIFFLIQTAVLFSQKAFHTNLAALAIKVNGKTIETEWEIDVSQKPQIFEVECKQKMNHVTFFLEKDSISFDVQKTSEINFTIIVDKKDTANILIKGIEPFANFTKEYIKKHKGKTIVEIPEVSELVNIIMALHKDAETEDNMFDTQTAYYQKVKKHFAPFTKHPIIDTIHKYIGNLYRIEAHDVDMFSNESYYYYYALKMNACAYIFDENGQIKNKGTFKEIANGWNTFDPLKDLELIEDFAKESNFRKFYKENKPYYDEVLQTYNQLNPIQKMQTWLDKKFGFSYGSYAIYFSPLINGAHSTKGYDEDDFGQTLMFICPATRNKEEPLIMNVLTESRVVFTEIDHNYVNPVSGKLLEKINKALSNRTIWAAEGITSAYQDPFMVFNEYMTFGIYSLYIYDNYSKKDLATFLPSMESQMVERRGFIQFKDFNDAMLAKYKQNTSIKMIALFEYMIKWSEKVNEK